MPKGKVEEGHCTGIKANPPSSPPRNLQHEVVVALTAAGETTGVTSVVEGTEKVGEATGERTLSNGKLGLEVRHALESFEIIFELINLALSEGLTELTAANRDTKDSETVLDNRHGSRQPH
jgi:hypothetical protein